MLRTLDLPVKEMPEWLTDDELPATDGEPLDSDWQRIAINLLVELCRTLFPSLSTYFAGGNMFVYYGPGRRQVRGPDFFVVKGVDGQPPREKWIGRVEEGRMPDIVVELLSPTTAIEDLVTKKGIYEREMRVPEYFAYNPVEVKLAGWRLNSIGAYQEIALDDRGFGWSEQLGCWLGPWDGEYQSKERTWLRLWREDGALIPTKEEAERARAEAERVRAEAERMRADAAEARVRELEARLGEQPSAGQ